MLAQLNYAYLSKRWWKFWPRLVAYLLFEGRPITTRGRWINPLVFANLALIKRLPRLRRIERPLFIVGTGRSGTTLLGMLLSMHAKVGYLNEPKASWHSVFPGEDLIGSYSGAAGRFRLADSDVTDDIKKRAHRIFGAYLMLSGSRRLVDKYPELIFRIPFIRAIFPDSQFVFLTRNGRDSCASVERWSDSHGGYTENESEDWWGKNDRKWNLLCQQIIAKDPYYKSIIEILPGINRQTDRAAIEWIASMREGINAEAKYPKTIIKIRYEDLVSNPREELIRICNFAGYEYDNRMMEYAEKTVDFRRNRLKVELDNKIAVLMEETLEILGYRD